MKKIAYEIGIGQLVIENISKEGKLSNRTVLLDGWAVPGNVAWSPDSTKVASPLLKRTEILLAA